MSGNGAAPPIDLGSQFATSWERYWRRQEYQRTKLTVEETVADELDTHTRWLWDRDHLLDQPELKRVLARAAQVRVMQEADNVCGGLVAAGRHCGSPIEVSMLSALCVVGGDVWDSVVLHDNEDEHVLGKADANWMLHVEPQAVIDGSRVDFLLTGTSKRFHSNGLGGCGDFSHWHEERMVVECDGHEFHERTREQASRDRQRDRRLQALGYLVYRYTGADIWRDVCTAAEEAVRTLQDPPSDRRD